MPQPFERAWAPMLGAGRALPVCRRLRVGHQRDVRRPRQLEARVPELPECLHCPTIHPKLATVLPYQSGANDLTEGPFLGGYMEIKAPNESATMSGRAAGRRVSDDAAARTIAIAPTTTR
mgnify:CR=1 FL=1